MGDISIIARRLTDGHVQYGWSGNGGYFRNTGIRLLAWYQKPENVEYLFSLGQTSLIGDIGSEEGGFPWFETHRLTGEPFGLDNTERMNFCTCRILPGCKKGTGNCRKSSNILRSFTVSQSKLWSP